MTRNATLNNEMSQKSSLCNVTECGLDAKGSAWVWSGEKPNQPPIRQKPNTFARNTTRSESEINCALSSDARVRMRGAATCSILIALCLH
jgi:hypothetical protein